jgi:parallel beta-helix repeat protein
MTYLQSSRALRLAVIISIIFIAGEVKAENFEGFEETEFNDPNWCIVISDAILSYDIHSSCFEKIFDPCVIVNGVTCFNRYYKFAPEVNEGHMFPMTALGSVCRCGSCAYTIDGLYVREGYSFQLYYNTQEPNDPNELVEASPLMCGPKRVSQEYTLYCSGNDPPCGCPEQYDPNTFYVPSSHYGDLGHFAIIVYRGCASIEKIDDVNENQCVLPGTTINYTINYSIDGNGISQNVRIVDYVPVEVNFISATSPYDYNTTSRIVTWYLGDLTLPVSDSVELTVQVKDNNQTGYTFTNIAEIQGNFAARRTENEIFVCFSGEIGDDIICVDSNAIGGLNDGTSWDDAFLDFNDGLAKARFVLQTKSSCEIWVAGHPQGYKPPIIGGDYYGATFRIPDGNIAIRGHFGGKARYEVSADQRNFNNPAYETIFDCCVGPYNERASYIVTCDDIGNGLLLDGFTITNASTGGLLINNYSDPSITKCKFTGSYYGIYADNYSYPDIADSSFLQNGYAGIYSQYSSWPWVKNCIFDGNNISQYGLYGQFSEMLIEDCTIKRQFYGGIYFTNSYLNLINCTIENNSGNGIFCYYCNNVEIMDCLLQNNNGYGINCTHSPLYVSRCIIQKNNNSGILISSTSAPTIINNKINNNKYYGINMEDCGDIEVKNNWIYFNGTSGNNSGLYFSYSISPPIIRNNTIAKNAPYGIYVYYGRDPCLINDIIWQNGDSNNKNVYSERGLDGIMASYCDIGGGFSGTGNINSAPCFVRIDINDFHLKYASNCIDAGDPNVDYDDQTDIDGQCRVIFGKTEERADIGADEFAPKADYNGDSIVNFNDFAILASAWMSANNLTITLDDDNDVDIYDLKLFCENWLWHAPCSQVYQSYMNELQMELIDSTGSTPSISSVQASSLQLEQLDMAEEPVAFVPNSAENQTEVVSQPLSREQIQFLIDWAEQIWTDPEIQEAIDPNDYHRMINSLYEELNN